MPYAQIRLNKTKEIQRTLNALKKRYHLMSESEIIKMLLSESYWRVKTETKAMYPDMDPKDLLMQASYAFDIRSDSNESDDIKRQKDSNRKTAKRKN